MRTNQVHSAIAQGKNRFTFCKLISKGVRIIHKDGGRLEDSITQVIGMLSPDPVGLASVAGLRIVSKV